MVEHFVLLLQRVKYAWLLRLQVDHPGQYLEGGVLASTDVTHKHFFFGSRRFKMHSNEGSLQVTYPFHLFHAPAWYVNR